MASPGLIGGQNTIVHRKCCMSYGRDEHIQNKHSRAKEYETCIQSKSKLNSYVPWYLLVVIFD